MVIDTSALLAILLDEPERRAFNEAIEATESCLMSTAIFVEVSMVIESRFGTEGLRDLDLFLERADIDLVPVDEEQPMRRAAPSVASARVVTAPGSTMAIVFPMRWHRSWVSPCSTKAKTLAIRI